MDKKAFAIAMSVKRKNSMKKKANESAPMEHRPSTQEEDQDKGEIERQEPMKKPSRIPLKEPSMAHSSVFKVRSQKEADEEKMAEGGQIKPEKPQGDTLNYKDLKKEYIAKNKPKYAEGGKIEEYGEMPEEDEEPMVPHRKMDNERLPVDEYMAGKFAEGGMIDDEDLQPEDEEHEEHHNSIAAAIMARKERKMMAEGGMVDIDENNEEQPNSFYKQNEDAALKENYDSDFDSISEPMDSNEHGDHLSDEDAHDMISRIRSRMHMKRQFKGE